MSRLRKFLALPAPERRVLLAATLLLPTVRLALSILPFRTMRRLVTRLARARNDGPLASPPSPARVGWAVRTAGRYVPRGGNCLAQALTAHVLLRRLGHPSRLRLGVARGAAPPVEAAARIANNGPVARGAARLTPYTPPPAFGPGGKNPGAGTPGARPP